MIGIPCYGQAHADRVRAAMEKLTPDLYSLLMQARGYAVKSMGDKGPQDTGLERAFIDRVNDILAWRRNSDERGETHVIWLATQEEAK